MILAVWESEQGRTEYGLRLLDRAEAWSQRTSAASC